MKFKPLEDDLIVNETRIIAETLIENMGRPFTFEEWIEKKNPLLGGASPKELIENGRAKTVLSFLESLQDGVY